MPQSRSAVFPNDKDSKKKVRPIAATNNTSNPVCASSDGIIIACLLRMEKAGEVNKWNFTKYWLVACLGYIALELLVQRGFALYITRKIEGGLKDEEKCIRS